MITIDKTTGHGRKDKNLQMSVFYRWANFGGYDCLICCAAECADMRVITNSYYYGTLDDLVYDLANDLEQSFEKIKKIQRDRKMTKYEVQNEHYKVAETIEAEDIVDACDAWTEQVPHEEHEKDYVITHRDKPAENAYNGVWRISRRVT